ncbi:MAG: L-lactate transport [Acidobacteriaceae bacterium]|nr:L-lactate transport [Acidobacteriaceae bacterium]
MNLPSIWSQTYSLHGLTPGVSALIAALPIFTLLFLLGVLRKPAWLAGLVGLAVTFLLATAGYGMPSMKALSAAAYGAAFGLFPISWIIFWAIALFKVTVESGKFEIIRDSIGRLTPDPRLQALLIAFAFGAFLEGGAGFGTPVAIAATMLTGLGFSAFSASAVCLLANTAPVAFGSIGIPVITLAGTTGLPLDKLSTAVGRFCSPVSLIIPLYLLVATGGFQSLSGVWIPAVLAGAVFAGMQLTISTFLGPQLTDILAALSAMAALVIYLRLRGKEVPEPLDTNLESSSSGARALQLGSRMLRTGLGVSETMEERKVAAGKEQSGMQVLSAWLPYGLLVACVLLWGIAPIQRLLNRGTIAFAWPLLHDQVMRVPPITLAPSPYHAIFTLNFFSAAGTACMMATFLAALCLGMSLSQFSKILIAAVRQLTLPILTVSVVLATGFLMNYCGATATLGLAFASTGFMFPFFSSLLGFLGVFLTGSDTSSNALFGNLQVVTAGRLGLNPVLMAAANSAGGVMGKMISLQTIAVAAAATGLSVREQSKLFRFTLKHSIFLACFVGCLALFYTYGLHL